MRGRGERDEKDVSLSRVVLFVFWRFKKKKKNTDQEGGDEKRSTKIVSSERRLPIFDDLRSFSFDLN